MKTDKWWAIPLTNGLDINIPITLIGIGIIILKLTGVINWSWWWITAPFWIGFPLMFSFITLYYLLGNNFFIFEISDFFVNIFKKIKSWLRLRMNL